MDDIAISGTLSVRFEGAEADELLARMAEPPPASSILGYLLQTLDAVTELGETPAALEVGRAAWGHLADAYETDHGTRPVTGGVATFCDIPIRVRDDLPSNEMLWVRGR